MNDLEKEAQISPVEACTIIGAAIGSFFMSAPSALRMPIGGVPWPSEGSDYGALFGAAIGKAVGEALPK